MKDKALCHFTYQFLFNSCRFPKKPNDYTLFFDPMQHNHIAVMRKNAVYIVPCADASGKQLSTADFEA
jgi:carnitine O-acetyltransferase